MYGGIFDIILIAVGFLSSILIGRYKSSHDSNPVSPYSCEIPRQSFASLDKIASNGIAYDRYPALSH